jgi:hypothetical protein
MSSGCSLSLSLAAALTASAAAAASAAAPLPYLYAPGFLSDGGDVLVGEPGEYTIETAEAWCTANFTAQSQCSACNACLAFTYDGPEGTIPPASTVYFKFVNWGVTLAAWSTYTLSTPPGPPIGPSCPYVLVPYFQNDLQTLNYAVTKDGSHLTPLNGGFAVLNSTPTLRDPFANRAPDGSLRLVATNGDANNNVLTWRSDDAGVSWGPLSQINIMQQLPAPAHVDNLWAPEWHWDAAANAFMLFFAARGQHILPTLPGPGCDGQQDYRFAFFFSHTTDWVTFTDPAVLFDPGCFFTGDGGIDGDIVVDEHGIFNLVYKDARGVGEGHDAELLRGVRIATSATLTGPYTKASVSDLLVPTLVEAPELYRAPDFSNDAGWFLYFDCSFWPVPPGRKRPPYGIAHSDTLVDAHWTFIEGACTGNTTLTSFPDGMTHGSFLCINETEHDALVARWPA